MGYTHSRASGARPYAIDPSRGTTYEPREVVEYFARANSHFFMTGRPAEQAQLDVLSTEFARTGMHFSAIDGRIAPTPLGWLSPSPIGRFFAPTERGGSSIHFDGRHSDCQLLNTMKGLINEGYDFAAQSPFSTNTQRNSCPSNAPTLRCVAGARRRDESARLDG